MVHKYVRHMEPNVQLIIECRLEQALYRVALDEFGEVDTLAPDEATARTHMKNTLDELDSVARGLTDFAPFWEGGSVTLDWEMTVGILIDAYTVPEAQGFPVPTYTVTGLPRGITFSSDRVLAGSPVSMGVGSIVVTATNSLGTADYTINYVAWLPPDDE